MVLLQVPDLCASSEVTTLVIGSRSIQPITLEMMRIPMIEHVFIMPESFQARSSSVNRIALASTAVHCCTPDRPRCPDEVSVISATYLAAHDTASRSVEITFGVGSSTGAEVSWRECVAAS